MGARFYTGAGKLGPFGTAGPQDQQDSLSHPNLTSLFESFPFKYPLCSRCSSFEPSPERTIPPKQLQLHSSRMQSTGIHSVTLHLSLHSLLGGI